MDFKLKRFTKSLCVKRIANIHYFEFTKGFHTYKDKHEFRELVYVDSGRLNVEGESYKGILLKNQFIIHRQNEVHSLYCDSGEAPNVIIIGFECDSEKLDSFSELASDMSASEQRILTEIIKEGRNVFSSPYDIPNLKDMKLRKSFPFGADQLIVMKLEELFISLIRRAETAGGDCGDACEGEKASDIARYLVENFDQRISLRELCFLFNTNKTTICKDIKKNYGKTVIGYVNELRIERAKKLLREGELSITEIASAVGFNSIHYFCRVFKLFENKTPYEYINTIKSKLDY